MRGKISEVFQSIQGEGIYLGEPQLFVRFFGCNMKCGFCDTRVDYFMEYEPRELFDELRLYNGHYHSVSFTGGEPLLQKDFLLEILKLTKEAGYTTYLETNGTLYEALEEVIDYVDIVAMDVKLPSSTGMEPLWPHHRLFLKTASVKETFLKIVVCHSTDEKDLNQALQLIKEINPAAILVLQPNSNESDKDIVEKMEHFRKICAAENIVTCVIPQVHRIVGMP